MNARDQERCAPSARDAQAASHKNRRIFFFRRFCSPYRLALSIFSSFLFQSLPRFSHSFDAGYFACGGQPARAGEGLSDNGEARPDDDQGERQKKRKGKREAKRKHRTDSGGYPTVGTSLLCSPGLFAVRFVFPVNCCLHLLVIVPLFYKQPCPPCSAPCAVLFFEGASFLFVGISCGPGSLISCSSSFSYLNFAVRTPRPETPLVHAHLALDQANRRQCHYLTGNAEEEGETENGENQVTSEFLHVQRMVNGSTASFFSFF